MAEASNLIEKLKKENKFFTSGVTLWWRTLRTWGALLTSSLGKVREFMHVFNNKKVQRRPKVDARLFLNGEIPIVS